MTPSWTRHLLWVDGLGGLAAGTLVFLARTPIATLYEVPVPVVTGIALANLAYGVCGTALAIAPRRSMAVVGAMAVANLTWPLVCAVLLVRYGTDASPFGVAHLVGEALYVGALGALEWRLRGALAR